MRRASLVVTDFAYGCLTLRRAHGVTDRVVALIAALGVACLPKRLSVTQQSYHQEYM